MVQVHTTETTPLITHTLDVEHGIITVPVAAPTPTHYSVFHVAQRINHKVSACELIIIICGMAIILAGIILLTKYVKH